jgi:hypothetical protein
MVMREVARPSQLHEQWTAGGSAHLAAVPCWHGVLAATRSLWPAALRLTVCQGVRPSYEQQAGALITVQVVQQAATKGISLIGLAGSLQCWKRGVD